MGLSSWSFYTMEWCVVKLRRTAQDVSHLEDLVLASILCRSGNLIPELRNAAYNCGQYGPVNAWFRSARPDNVLPVPKTSTLLGVGVHCLSQWNCFWVRVKFCVLLEFYFVKNWIASKKLQSPVGYEIMFLKRREHVRCRVRCFPPDQLASSPPRYPRTWRRL
jgi:hypothetical protein